MAEVELTASQLESFLRHAYLNKVITYKCPPWYKHITEVIGKVDRIEGWIEDGDGRMWFMIRDTKHECSAEYFINNTTIHGNT